MCNKRITFKQPIDLIETEKLAWHLLSGDSFRVIAFASVAHNNVPEVRHLILRGVDSSARTLSLWSDIRSPKILSINNNPVVSLSGYSEQFSIQLGCIGQVSVHHKDALSREIWCNATPYNKMAYSYLPPGAHIDTRLQKNILERDVEPNHENTAMGFENFCILRVVVTELNYLHLDRSGNSKAQFEYNNDRELINASWSA